MFEQTVKTLFPDVISRAPYVIDVLVVLRNKERVKRIEIGQCLLLCTYFIVGQIETVLIDRLLANYAVRLKIQIWQQNTTNSNSTNRPKKGGSRGKKLLAYIGLIYPRFLNKLTMTMT